MLEARAIDQPFKVKVDDMPGAPFYRMEQVGGQKILYINKGHRFYTALYASPQANPHVRYALESLLFVMGECEIRAKEDRQAFYEQERQAWSVNLNTTLKKLEDWNTSEDMAAAEVEADEANRAHVAPDGSSRNRRGLKVCRDRAKARSRHLLSMCSNEQLCPHCP